MPRPSERVTAMKWETPSFVEINMSAEIGGYQSDFGDRDPVGPAETVERGSPERGPTPSAGDAR
jgi:hypothetical protein